MLSDSAKPKVAITGSTGFLGKAITNHLCNKGYMVAPISRHDLKEGPQRVAEIIEGAEIIINLAGAPILKKWTEAYKQEIYYSRILNTRILAEAIHLSPNKPKIFLSTSAVGIYNTIDVHDEYSEKLADGFLAKVCMDWEKEVYSLMKVEELRLVIFRLGVVLGNSGGAFPMLKTQFKLCMGGRIGNGKQWFPFVHLGDVLGALDFVFDNPRANGVYNLVAPQTCTNKQFGKSLAKALHRPFGFPSPKWLLAALYGEAVTTLTDGQYVKPHRLTLEGYIFKFGNVIDTVNDLAKNSKTP